MPSLISAKENQLIIHFSGANKGIKYVQERLLASGFQRSISSIWRVINNKGKKREAAINDQVWRYQRSSPILTPSNLQNIKRKFSVPNPPTFRQASFDMKIPKITVHRAVKRNLKMSRKKKIKLHQLTETDKKNRSINSRKLYENVLSGEKSKFVVTLDESWITKLPGQSKRSHYYVCFNSKKERIVENVKQSFPPKFMIVGAMSQSRTFPLIKVPGRVKVNADYYVNYILDPSIRNHLVPHYGQDINKVTIHHDKAPSHTANYTTNYFENIKQELGISSIHKNLIPVKGADISPMDFYGFGVIKQRLMKCKATSEDGIWKQCQLIWDRVSPESCQSVFKSWKRRLRQVRKMSGGHVEQVKDIHSRKINKLGAN